MQPFICSCGKSHLHIQDLIDCYYSGHDQVNDIQAQANRLLEISGACRFTCAVFDDGYSSFNLKFNSPRGSMTDESFQALLGRVVKSPSSSKPERDLVSGIPPTPPRATKGGAGL